MLRTNLLICALQKPESTLDQIKKSYPKLKPTDAGLLSIAVVLSGRYALAYYEEEQYDWPNDYDRLTQSLMRELDVVKQTTDEAPKRAKSAEVEVPQIKISLVSNFAAGERILGDREDLKKLLSEILVDGVEYTFGSNDIGWQWALDRANWKVLSKGEYIQKVHFVTAFPEVDNKKKPRATAKKAKEEVS
jgi:hypothetical protein